MTLFQPLNLDDAATVGVDLVPTKQFFKPVLILDVPITATTAEILQCQYLFTQHGEPVAFEGAHKLTHELAGAELTLTGKTGRVVLKTDKITRFSLSVTEKTSMTLRFRAHLPENEKKLVELLHFLAKLNKDKFGVTIKDQQKSITEQLADVAAAGHQAEGAPTGDDSIQGFLQPGEDGLYPTDRATRRNVKSAMLEVELLVVEVRGDNFVGGYTGRWKKGEAVGEYPSDQSRFYSTSDMALASAAQSAFNWVQAVIEANGPKEIAAKAAVCGKLQELFVEPLAAKEGASKHVN